MNNKIVCPHCGKEINHETKNEWSDAETLVSVLLGAERTDWKSPYDCLLKNGIRLEVKFSNTLSDKNKYSYFKWFHPFGHNGVKKGEYDYLILCGIYKDEWFFWVIPHDEVFFTNTIDMYIEGLISGNFRRGRTFDKCMPYYVGGIDELKEFFNG